ncbi:MAG: heavy-metal-associated domain-containing protein [bacterium]|nr:heavy-metal-associated domain-containing protein [bacterium]
MNKVHYNVTGLQNTDVKTQVKNALGKIDGISMVNVDLARSSIEVGYNGATDENTIKSCIENVGCRIQ